MPNIVQEWGYVGLETVLATPPPSQLQARIPYVKLRARVERKWVIK